MSSRFAQRCVSALATSLTAALLLTSCAASEPEVATSPTVTSTPDSSAGSVTEVEIAATPVGERMQMIVDLLNRDADITEADLDGVFARAVLDVAPLPDIVELLNVQIRPAQPLIVTGYDGTDTQAVAQIQGAIGEPFAIHLQLDAEGLADTFALTPATTPDPAQSLGEVEERWAALPVTVRYAAVLTHADGTREVLLESGADQSAPTASMFKLYVLLAVHKQISAGTLAWTDPLIITDNNRSLPSGVLQDEPNGTTVTVREAAEKMISISDNTATDMLIEAVGRDAVEAAVVAAGHHDPSALAPFVTTREMFELTFGANAAVRDAWATADETARRDLLAGLTIDLAAIDLEAISLEPQWPNGLDWLASPTDIAAAHDALAALDDDTIDAILTMNPGLGVDPAQWSSLAYKGGSSLGVLTGSWRAEAADGTTLTLVVMGSADSAEDMFASEIEIFSLAGDVLRLAR